MYLFFDCFKSAKVYLYRLFCFPFQCVLNAFLILLFSVSNVNAASPEQTDNPANREAYRQIIQEMKKNQRGPFRRLRWFCNDGTVLPPKSYACANHGGGRQHGQWSEKTIALREEGFFIGNVLAATNPAALVEDVSPSAELRAILLEQFLIAIDDGWILREARFYRGAFQIEGEQRATASILEELTGVGQPIENQFFLILEAVKHLPGNSSNQSLLANIRTSATSIQRDHASFMDLRNKIHGRLDVSDALLLRQFIKNNKGLKRQEDILALAENIETLFSPSTTSELLGRIDVLRNTELTKLTDAFRKAGDHHDRYVSLAKMFPLVRQLIERESKDRVERFMLLSELEQLAFASGREIINGGLAKLSREQMLSLLSAAHDVLYGTGLLTEVERQQATDFIISSSASKNVDGSYILKDYRDLLQQLARVPTWSERRVQFFFQEQVNKFSII